MTLIAASGIRVRAGRTTLLNDVSFAAAAGEVVALVGPNGAGKSTLLRVLSGELKPNAGDVRLKGRALSDYAPRELALHRAVLPQSTQVSFPFTVDEIVRMGRCEGTVGPVDARVERALHDVDLGALKGRVITTMSGGEQQRAHVARVLVQLSCMEEAYGSGLLLLDEPTASLDFKHQLDLVAIARRCARQHAVVIVLHDLNLAAACADRIVVLHKGRVAISGLPIETITDETLEQVFAVSASTGRLPAKNVPFVLPQARPLAF